MIDPETQWYLGEFVTHWLLVLVGMGFAAGLLIAIERLLQSAIGEPDLAESIKTAISEVELVEMVNAEMDDWGYQLHELDLDNALPQWLVDDMRQRMLHVASAAANGRKSKVEDES